MFYITRLQFMLLAVIVFSVSFAIAQQQSDSSDAPSKAASAKSASSEAGAEAQIVAPKGMVYIPEGSFLMGCSPGDSRCSKDEKPAHQVAVEGFFMDATMATNEQYRQCVKSGKCEALPDNGCIRFSGSHWTSSGSVSKEYKRKESPVVCASWRQAASYCQHQGKRLPTEAEWEYAARGGTTGPFYAEVDEIAWSSSSGEMTHPVGRKEPNAYGLYDMLGNANEWCADWFDENYYSLSPSDNPKGPDSGRERVRRGGSSADMTYVLRASSRQGSAPDNRDVFTGFRCAQSVPKKTGSPATTQEKSSDSESQADEDQNMVRVPGGTFMMGCPVDDAECFPFEKPAHSVSIAGFWMDKTPVTQSQYHYVMGANPSHFSGCADCPVEMVNWNDAQNYCARVGKRLPTEAQWEFAARAGAAGGRYAELDEVAWYAGNSSDKTHPVAQKQPNAYGLYDMRGNVWEWCADWYAEDYYSHSPSNNPKGPKTGRSRVIKGGSWHNNPKGVRAVSRTGCDPVQRGAELGFRCVRDGQSAGN